jgi:hypothetical protein
VANADCLHLANEAALGAARKGETTYPASADWSTRFRNLNVGVRRPGIIPNHACKLPVLDRLSSGRPVEGVALVGPHRQRRADRQAERCEGRSPPPTCQRPALEVALPRTRDARWLKPALHGQELPATRRWSTLSHTAGVGASRTVRRASTKGSQNLSSEPGPGVMIVSGGSHFIPRLAA